MEAIKSSYVVKNPMLMYYSKQQELDMAIEKLNKI